MQIYIFTCNECKDDWEDPKNLSFSVNQNMQNRLKMPENG